MESRFQDHGTLLSCKYLVTRYPVWRGPMTDCHDTSLHSSDTDIISGILTSYYACNCNLVQKNRGRNFWIWVSSVQSPTVLNSLNWGWSCPLRQLNSQQRTHTGGSDPESVSIFQIFIYVFDLRPYYPNIDVVLLSWNKHLQRMLLKVNTDDFSSSLDF